MVSLKYRKGSAGDRPPLGIDDAAEATFMADLVAKALEECQNGLRHRHFSMALPQGHCHHEIAVAIHGYASGINADIRMRDKGWELLVPRAHVTVEVTGSTVTVSGRRLEPSRLYG